MHAAGPDRWPGGCECRGGDTMNALAAYERWTVSRPAWEQVTGVRYRLEVRLTPADVGQRVVIRWRRPSPGDGEQIADVLGILEENDTASFAVRTSDGALVVIPAARALAGKVVPPAPQNRRRAGPAPL